MEKKKRLILNHLDDIENQQAVRLAKEADPAGERTIGELNGYILRSSLRS